VRSRVPCDSAHIQRTPPPMSTVATKADIGLDRAVARLQQLSSVDTSAVWSGFQAGGRREPLTHPSTLADFMGSTASQVWHRNGRGPFPCSTTTTILRPHFGQVGISLAKETPCLALLKAEQHHARSRAAIDPMGNGHALAPGAQSYGGHRRAVPAHSS
jgi:hypothetical protein